jgi:hypothetical protein
MPLEHRLRRLEKRTAPPVDDRCGECGLPFPGSPWTGVQISVGWHAPGDPEDLPCRVCGQKRSIRIEFDRAG